MKISAESLKNHSGFTLVELLVVFAIISALVSVAIPTFSVWLPNYRLKSAAMDLYSNFQLTKMKAVRANRDFGIVFDFANGSYQIVDYGSNGTYDAGTDAVEKTVNYSNYDTNGSIGYGKGYATFSATETPGTIPSDFISFNGNNVALTPQGTADKNGYVYIGNIKGRAYAIGMLTSGIIKLKKWTGSAWE